MKPRSLRISFPAYLSLAAFCAALVGIGVGSPATAAAAAPAAEASLQAICFPYPLTVCCDASGCWLY